MLSESLQRSCNNLLEKEMEGISEIIPDEHNKSVHENFNEGLERVG